MRCRGWCNHRYSPQKYRNTIPNSFFRALMFLQFLPSGVIRTRAAKTGLKIAFLDICFRTTTGFAELEKVSPAYHEHRYTAGLSFGSAGLARRTVFLTILL